MSNFRFDPSRVVNGLSRLGSAVPIAVQMYAETVASDFQSYAKQHRPWTDRTGRARQGLTGYVRKTTTGYRIYLAHTVDYGIWLEMAHEKKYAILEPTVRLKGPDAVRGLSHLLDGLGGIR